jgi:hypothetical protein
LESSQRIRLYGDRKLQPSHQFHYRFGGTHAPSRVLTGALAGQCVFQICVHPRRGESRKREKTAVVKTTPGPPRPSASALCPLPDEIFVCFVSWLTLNRPLRQFVSIRVNSCQTFSQPKNPSPLCILLARRIPLRAGEDGCAFTLIHPGQKFYRTAFMSLSRNPLNADISAAADEVCAGAAQGQ